jgi:Fe-S oxidoreductase
MEPVTPLKEIADEIKGAGGASYDVCYQCGKCDVVCPWNRVRQFSIRRIVRQAAFGLPEFEGEDVWRCTTCGSCPSQCPRGVDQIRVGVAVRRVATRYGAVPDAARGVRVAAQSLACDGNPLGFERGARGAWAEGLSVKPFAEGMEILYFVGCYGSHDPRMQKVARATVAVLQKAGVDFGILGTEESCCGESIRKAGDEDVFKALARRNIRTFVDRGVKRILVSSPHCYQAFANEYREFMVAFEVVHVAQYLAELVAQGRIVLGGEVRRKVTWHDPCYLGRHNGVYDPPREVLRRIPGLELTEMQESRKDSLCCGGGGGRMWLDTPKAERFSDIRLAQARATGADVLATSCPYCISNFEEARLSLADDDPLQIKDVTELINDSLQGIEETL